MSTTIPSGLATPLTATAPNEHQPIFKFFYDPVEMLKMGVFGGNFFFKGANRDRINTQMLDHVPFQNWGSPEYDSSKNFYGVTNLERVGNVGASILFKEPHKMHSHWFLWYCQFFQGYSIESHISQFRILQQRNQLVVYSHVLETTTYTPPPGNPQNYNKYTDPGFLPIIKQAMLELAWDPTKKPSDFGII